MTPPRVFLDANVLFSAALGGETFELILDLAERGRIDAVTSLRCMLEAQDNLMKKQPAQAAHLDHVTEPVRIEDVEPEEQASVAAGLVHAADVHVLAAALTLGVDVLVTGDVTHFGALMERSDLPLRVRTPRAFLLEGPSGAGPVEGDR